MESSGHRQWRERALVLALLLTGAALRLVALGHAPPGLYHDEAQHGLDALNVLQGNFPLYFAANNGREPLFIYLVTACVGLLGRSPLAVRLPSFCAGFLTLAATYDLGRVFFNRRVGRWALAVLAVTFWHVHLSRVGFRAVLLPLFTALFLAQAARAVKTNRARHWVAAGALYGVTWYTYMAARFTPVVLAAFLLYALTFHRERVRTAWRGALLFGAAALLVLTPLGVYTLQHPDVVLARTGQVSVFSPEINGGDPWGALLQHTWRAAEMFFVRGDRIWRHNLAWRPVWDPALGLAFVIGLGVALAGCRRHAGAALVVLWTAIMTLPTLLAEDTPHFLRGAGVLPVAALLPALGLAWITSHKLQVASCKLRAACIPPIAGILALLLWGFGLVSTTTDYFVRYAHAPLAYHWFEAGPVELAGRVNTLLGVGWDGEKMLHGPATGRDVYLDPRLWDSWTALPFLIPEERVKFLPVVDTPELGDGLAFIVWPYGDWRAQVLPHLPHPAYLSVTEGPQAQDDKAPAPVTIALIVQAEPRPEVPAAVAHFEDGILLRAALVRPEPGGARVRLWWDAEAAPSAPYTVFVHYLRDGEPLTQYDGPPALGALPTTLWQAGDLILDERFLPDVTPDPARDTLRVGLYHSESGKGLSVLDVAGNPAGGWVDLGVILSQ